MTPHAASSAHIRRVRLRAAAHMLDSARAPVAQALQQAAWPATAQGETLILRRIVARGQPHELAARAAANAQEMARAAIDGWSPAAATAQAVRFASRASLLACLCRDRLQAGRPRPWYWQAWTDLWAQTEHAAVLTLTQQEPLALPTILRAVQEQDLGPRFWTALGSAGAQTLLEAIAHASHWPAVISAARIGVTAQARATGLAPTPTPAVTPHALSAIHAMLRGLNPSAGDARGLLAAVLTLWQTAPQRLQHQDGANELLALAHSLGSASPAPAQPTTRPALAPASQHQTLSPSSLAAAPLANDAPAAALTAPTPSNAHASPAKEKRARAASRVSNAAHQAAPADNTLVNHAAHLIEDPASATTTPSLTEPTALPATAPGFITASGGLFYLLNFLNRPAVQARLPQSAPGLGWRSLYELALAFGCPPDAPLLNFFAQAVGLRAGAELAALPACTDAQALLALGAQRYEAEVWQADSWRRSARVIATPGHVDVHLRLSDVDLAVRRSGLDVNPGWLPWLGSVVTLHYGSGLEP